MFPILRRKGVSPVLVCAQVHKPVRDQAEMWALEPGSKMQTMGRGAAGPGGPTCAKENEEECWVCLDYGRLYEFQKIDFPSPVWLDIKARQNFIESVPTWLDFWTLELWPVDSIMNAFVFSYLLHGFTFTNWPIDSAIIVFSPDLFPYSCVFYNCEELWVHCWEMVQWHSQ